MDLDGNDTLWRPLKRETKGKEETVKPSLLIRRIIKETLDLNIGGDISDF